MTVSEQGLVIPPSGKLALPEYMRPQPGNHPPLDFPGYKSTALRHPKQPLVYMPQTVTEITGPQLGPALLGEKLPRTRCILPPIRLLDLRQCVRVTPG